MSAMPISRTTPMIHEMMAAGPAALDAFSVPSSQPDPMTEPAETMNSGSSPTSRRSLGGTSERSELIPHASLSAIAGGSSALCHYRSMQNRYISPGHRAYSGPGGDAW